MPVHSVLDAGCGRGDFLRAFLDAGVTDVLGLDGDYVPRDQLLIDASAFRATDLAAAFAVGRRYDLVVSVEVAEHLPASAAETFVGSLTRHGSVALFSAAIPHQPGVGHINGQWPSYWARIFARHGYKPYDVIRPAIWHDQDVAWWYRQNLLLYATDDAAAAMPELRQMSPLPIGMLDLVHPELYLSQLDQLRPLAAQMANVQNLLRRATSFEVEHRPDGQMIIKPRSA